MRINLTAEEKELLEARHKRERDGRVKRSS
jgi:hypothetical protein